MHWLEKTVRQYAQVSVSMDVKYAYSMYCIAVFCDLFSQAIISSDTSFRESGSFRPRARVEITHGQNDTQPKDSLPKRPVTSFRNI